MSAIQKTFDAAAFSPWFVRASADGRWDRSNDAPDEGLETRFRNERAREAGHWKMQIVAP